MNHSLPPPARTLIADLAAQRPELLHWLAGWAEGKGLQPGRGKLVVDGAHIEVEDDAAAPSQVETRSEDVNVPRPAGAA